MKVITAPELVESAAQIDTTLGRLPRRERDEASDDDGIDPLSDGEAPAGDVQMLPGVVGFEKHA